MMTTVVSGWESVNCSRSIIIHDSPVGVSVIVRIVPIGLVGRMGIVMVLRRLVMGVLVMLVIVRLAMAVAGMLVVVVVLRLLIIVVLSVAVP